MTSPVAALQRIALASPPASQPNDVLALQRVLGNRAVRGLLQGAVRVATSGTGGALPYQSAIQQSFGRYDISGIQAHTDPAAAAGARAMRAEAFTSANHVAFAGSATLHTAAHEAAHAVQQRLGGLPDGYVSDVGDRHEQHANEVADLVIQGKSSEALLDRYASGVHGKGGARPMPSRAIGAAPVQRKIKVDNMNDGKEIEAAAKAPGDWGLTLAENLVYEQWLKDNTDHHYTTGELLAQAIKAEVRPTTESFEAIFRSVAQESNLTVHWLEQILTEPAEALKGLGQSSASEISEVIETRTSKKIPASELSAMNIHDLISVLFETGTITQSCGQTASLVHSVLAPSSYAQQKPTQSSASDVCDAVRSADQQSMVHRKHYYCRVEGAGHAFIIECFNGRAKIYQSFFGAYTMAKDLGRGKSYGLEEFLTLLTQAMKEENNIKTMPAQVKQARTELFSCNPEQFHPDGTFMTTVFTQEAGANERIVDKGVGLSDKWNKQLGKASSTVLKPDVVVKAPKKGDVFDIVFFQNGFLFYDADTYAPVAWGDLEANKVYSLRYMDAYVIEATLSDIDKSAKDKAAWTCKVTIE